MSTQKPTSGIGQQIPQDSQDRYAIQDFQIRQRIKQVNVGKLVVIKAVYDADGNAVDPDKTGQTGPVGFVDVQPLVNQVDGQGNSLTHGIIYKIPYIRTQGGSNGFICDPQVGDIGHIGHPDRDISTVIANRSNEPVNPGSFGTHRGADAVYTGATLNGELKQWFRFRSDGVEFVDANGNTYVTNGDGITVTDKSGSTIVMTGGGITLTPKTGPVKIVGDCQVTGQLTGEFGSANSVGLTTHKHNQPNDSAGDTEQPTDPPIPGT